MHNYMQLTLNLTLFLTLTPIVSTLLIKIIPYLNSMTNSYY